MFGFGFLAGLGLAGFLGFGIEFVFLVEVVQVGLLFGFVLAFEKSELVV